jgi:hypothetical protein
MRQRAELLAHITNTNHQYNLPALARLSLLEGVEGGK